MRLAHSVLIFMSFNFRLYCLTQKPMINSYFSKHLNFFYYLFLNNLL